LIINKDMKKISVLLVVALFAFGCNSAEKNKEEAKTDTQEATLQNLVEVSISTQGMTCEGCENAIKKSVSSLAGVAEVTASHVDSVTVVKYDTTAVSLAAIEDKIAEAGYTVVN